MARKNTDALIVMPYTSVARNLGSSSGRHSHNHTLREGDVWPSTITEVACIMGARLAVARDTRAIVLPGENTFGRAMPSTAWFMERTVREELQALETAAATGQVAPISPILARGGLNTSAHQLLWALRAAARVPATDIAVLAVGSHARRCETLVEALKPRRVRVEVINANSVLGEHGKQYAELINFFDNRNEPYEAELRRQTGQMRRFGPLAGMATMMMYRAGTVIHKPNVVDVVRDTDGSLVYRQMRARQWLASLQPSQNIMTTL